ncbi:hypothetical protein [Sphingomicrobium marinum]|uniref:hypothetical protein n=1 Tax=Sphingomicrobium marinum TaxID=1227950 RepID=UPI00223FF7E5|nr:hypothetical protein [Sphingomicrobium marinum]
MDDPAPTTHRAVARTKWLSELEAALDRCDELASALRVCAADSQEANALRRDIAAAKKEITRIRCARPLGIGENCRPVTQAGLATWRGNRID